MEHAPLRPVPARPAGPIDPAAALREVSSWLPALSPVAVRALALVVLGERPRADVASALDVSEAELAELLAEARKELRQTIVVLGGSGWCERAEGLISDRLDGALADRDIRRLDVHLRNCARCVEHERRLVQATDALVRSLGTPPAPVSTPPVPLVEAPEGPGKVEPPGGDGAAGADAPPADEAPPIADLPPADEAPPVDAPPADDTPPIAELPPADGGGEEETSERPAVPAPIARPAPAAPSEDQIAAAAEVLVAARTRRQIAAAVVWNSLIAIAILLTLVTIALTVAGILGAEL